MAKPGRRNSEKTGGEKTGEEEAAPKRAPARKPAAQTETRRARAGTPGARRARSTSARCFCAAFAVCASIRDAAKAARITRRQHYNWLKDPAYAARFADIKAEACQSLEDEAVERATRGVFEPNVFQGKFVYPQEEVVTAAVVGPRGGIVEPERREWRDVPGALPFGIWRKSDTLLIHLSRGLMPEKYGMRGALEVYGPQGGPIEIVERLNAGRARLAAMSKPETAA